jgi:hypothetical protein
MCSSADVLFCIFLGTFLAAAHKGLLADQLNTASIGQLVVVVVVKEIYGHNNYTMPVTGSCCLCGELSKKCCLSQAAICVLISEWVDVQSHQCC